MASEASNPVTSKPASVRFLQADIQAIPFVSYISIDEAQRSSWRPAGLGQQLRMQRCSVCNSPRPQTATVGLSSLFLPIFLMVTQLIRLRCRLCHVEGVEDELLQDGTIVVKPRLFKCLGTRRALYGLVWYVTPLPFY